MAHRIGKFEGVRFRGDLPEGDDVDVETLPVLQVTQQAFQVGLGDAVQHIGVVHHKALGGRAFVQYGELTGVRDRHSGAEAQDGRERQGGQSCAHSGLGLVQGVAQARFGCCHCQAALRFALPCSGG